MKKKKYKKKVSENKVELNKLVTSINNIGNNFNEHWNAENIKTYSFLSHSWFDINVSVNKDTCLHTHYNFDTEKLKPVTYKCAKQIILPNEEQKRILLNWFDAYAKMYNETLRVLKKMQYNGGTTSFSFQTVRTEYMKNIKESILNASGESKDTRIPCHTLDCAIKDVCTSFKSAFTNLRNGNIKHFRIRYLKSSKLQKILKLEQSAFQSMNKNTFCPSVFGEKIITNNNIDFSDVECGATILYNSRNNRFTLLKPIKINMSDNNDFKMYKYISLDPGIRTFLTGYSHKHVTEICTNLKEKISEQLKNIDLINKSNLSKKKKKKAENKRYEKIKNLVDDLHWKTIKHLTDKYDTILIGNMSTKSIVKNKSVGDLDNMTKRVALLMKLYEFRERLKYKCYINGCKYGNINEMYTSKTCSYCGNVKENLKGNKIYKCEKCHIVIDRDINGARNILMKSIL